MTTATKPPREKVPSGLRVLQTIAERGDAGVSPAVDAMLLGAQRVLFGTDLRVADLDPIDPADLGRVWRDEPAFARQLLQAMLAVSLADDLPSNEQAELVARYASALGISAAELATTRLLATEHMLFARFHDVRRMQSSTDEVAPLSGFLLLRGTTVTQPELAARYRALATLPSGTLGRDLLEYFDANALPLPGEKGAFPEVGVWHDLGHVLTGYGTDPEGELELAAFLGGCSKEKLVYLYLFAAFAQSGAVLERADLGARVARALDRAASVSVDLSARWDHWPWLARPIDEVRAAFGIAPP